MSGSNNGVLIRLVAAFAVMFGVDTIASNVSAGAKSKRSVSRGACFVRVALEIVGR